MGNTRFLYGAAVQGIQGFIFQTNELRDIVGASELVDEICTTDFDEFAEHKGLGVDNNSIVRAAGNIKYVFDSEEMCKKAVREFPKKVQSKAPGITVSQAVVPLDSDNFADAVDLLERKLCTQRNRPMRSAIWGMQGIKRSRKTGLPVVKIDKETDEYLDEAILKKRKDRQKITMRVCEKALGYEADKLRDKIAFDIKDITAKNDWIAIVHADGNGLGQVIQKIGKNKDKLADFSQKLNEVTCEAAVKAYKEIEKIIEDELAEQGSYIPVRPVVLSGDDLTVIIRGDLALQYAEYFLLFFEETTKRTMPGIVQEGKGLTACAGIAFIKSSYPFYYGYELAEALCSRAKKRAKEIDEELAPSCLMFHKVQDSFVEDYDEIVRRELTPHEGSSFEFGPYFVEPQQGYWQIGGLNNKVEQLSVDEGNSIKSHIRQWIGLMYKPDGGKGQAEQKKRRLLNMVEQQNVTFKSLVEEMTDYTTKNEVKRYPAYDVLSLYSVKYQITRNK